MKTEASKSIDPISMSAFLQARGFQLINYNPDDQLLTGASQSEQVLDQFYKKLGKYSFRLFLRELLENQNNIQSDTVSRYCSESAANRYLDFLTRLGLLEQRVETYHITSDFVPNFGETLEWYVAEIFKREFGAQAIYRVALYKSIIGGDLDVLTNWAGRLIYLEVKSSPPKAVEASQIQLFFTRMWELLPEMAIFLEDTHLRMKDKIVKLFQEELARHYGPLSQKKFPLVRLQDELFHINHTVYIINSKRGIIHNIKVCLRDYLRNQQQLMGMP